MSDAPASRGTDEESDRADRRRYLALVGVAAASLAGCLGFGSDGGAGDDPPADRPDGSDGGASDDPPDAEGDGGRFDSRHGIEFDRVLDAVEDLGLDPSGDVGVEDALEAALSADGTAVVFPEGEYRVGSPIALDAERIGVIGVGSVRFVPERGFDGLLFDGTGVRLDGLIVENVDVDVRAPDTTAGFRIRCRERFHVENVEFLGRGTNDSDGGTTSAFLLALRDADGRGTLRNVVAKKGSRIDGYEGGNGRIGVWVGWSNKGTVRIEDCDFREFGNNGVYGSRTPGNVEIVDCYFRNNNVCGARIGGAGSYVEDCTIEIDLDRYTGPPVDTATEFNTRAIVVEQGLANPGPALPAGAEVRGCTIRARRSPLSQAVIEHSPVARSLLIRDTEIRCDIDGTPAVRRGPVGSVPYRPDRRRPPPPHWTRLENVTIGGSAAGGAAVDLNSAPGSAVTDCEIRCRGADRDGVFLDHSPESTVSGSTIRTDGHPLVVATDPTVSTSRQVVCLGLETVLERTGSGGPFDDLTANPAVFRTLVRNVRTNTVCLGLGPVVSTPSFISSLDDADSLEIGVEALEDGAPVGSLLNR